MEDSTLWLQRRAEFLMSGSAKIGIIGMGYVGLPMALAFWRSGAYIVGIDKNHDLISQIMRGRSPLPHIASDDLAKAVASGNFVVTDDFAELEQCHAILLCVPTPVREDRTPDLSIVINATKSLSGTLQRGQLVAFESTSWPGTTQEIVRPVLDQAGLTLGKDYFLAFSPEREDPGNKHFSAHNTPKVVGADDSGSTLLANALYSRIASVVPVSSSRVAEAAKITENVFRSVNIGLVNELKIVFSAMNVDIWEVVNAAATKPFGYMPFYPGPGVGGHCIPIDPLYLSSKARELSLPTRLIDVAADVHAFMPIYIIDQIAIALDRASGRGLQGARILIVGVAYKKNISDMRQSPALEIMWRLRERGAEVGFTDPYVPNLCLRRPRSTPEPANLDLQSLNIFKNFDVAVFVTDHDNVDYALICQEVPIIVDTRNICQKHNLQPHYLCKA